MGLSRFESPFPPLQLSHADSERIVQLVHMLVHARVAQYEQHLGPGRSHVDERTWKFMRERENVRVYAERRRRRRHRQQSRHERAAATDAAHHHPALSTPARPTGSALVSPTASNASSGFASTRAAPDLPVIHVVGSVDGTLDDILYGIVNPTLDVMRVKASYIDVNLGHLAVLATLVSPTVEQPFESITIKWVENVQKALLRPAVNSRDFVYIEATGTTCTATGERVGYHLLHSVHFPQTPVLPSFVRGNMSICGLYRQLPGFHTDVFFKGTLDPGGLALRPLVVIAAVDVFIAIWKYVACARLKKLAWLLRTQSCAVVTTSGRESSVGESSGATSLGLTSGSVCDSIHKTSEVQLQRQLQQQMHAPMQCVVCCKPPAIRLLASLRRRRCSLCFHYICSHCRVTKTLCHLLSATDAKLLQRAFAFCPACYTDAIKADAFAIAQQEVAARDALAVGSELFLRGSSSSERSRFSSSSLADSLFS